MLKMNLFSITSSPTCPGAGIKWQRHACCTFVPTTAGAHAKQLEHIALTTERILSTGTEIDETVNSGRNERNLTEWPGSAGMQAGTGLRSECSSQQCGIGYTSHFGRYRNRTDNYGSGTGSSGVNATSTERRQPPPQPQLGLARGTAVRREREHA
jgi:hypothetical protein